MPIKLPKGFARRKSAGNVLEAYQNPPAEPSFRVISRDEIEEYGSSGQGLARDKVPGRPKSSSPLRNHRNHHPSDDGRYLSYRTYNSSSPDVASSTRHNYHPMDPSSLASTSTNDLRFVDQAPPLPRHATFESQDFEHEREEEEEEEEEEEIIEKEAPAPSPNRQKFLMARSRFETGGEAKSGSESTERRGRSRTMTSSANSPLPRDVCSGPGLENGNNSDVGRPWYDVANLYRQSPFTDQPSPSVGLFGSSKPKIRSEADSLFGAEHRVSSEENDELFPARISPSRSVAEMKSQRTSSEYEPRKSLDNRSLEGFSPLMGHASQTLVDAAYASQALERQHGTDFRGSPAIMDRPRGFNERYATPPSPRRLELRDHRESPVNHSSRVTTPRLQTDESDSLFDNSPASTVLHHINERSSPVITSSRIMTPAEFELAKKTAEIAEGNELDSEQPEEENLYEDEDETERNRQVAKQTRRQQAKLAVYRQQMMKVTGEKLTGFPEQRKQSRTSQGVSNFTATPDLTSSAGKSDLAGDNKGDGDESDEEIPLGVLQAHGFPTRSRPPSRMADNANRSSTHLPSYPSPPGSTRNDTSAGGGGSGSLPPFARNLPADPYIGANLVNQTNRQSLPYNASSVAAANSPSTPLPPGGLVGVIVGEERARALRRGSPNSNGVFGPSTPQSMLMNPHQISPNEQAQMEMSNQMTHMMQMQMQWMQQMMQLQAMSQQTGTPMPPMPQMPGMPFVSNNAQQAQAGTQQTEFLNPPCPQPQKRYSAPNLGLAHQRSTSTLSSYLNGTPSAPSTFGITPPTSIEGVRSSYAPSLAPSERSNVGQPSRYRPVTPSENSNVRSSTMSSTTSPVGFTNTRSRSPLKESSFYNQAGNPYGSTDASGLSRTIRAVNKPKRGSGGGLSDDEDDEGWAEMKKKRERRKSQWRSRRNTFTGAKAGVGANEGMEGLFYEESL